MKFKLKRGFLSGVLAFSMVASCLGMTVDAANVKEIPAEEVESVYNLEVDSNALEGWAQGPQIYSESGIVMDIDSGAILYAKNIDDQHYPASITKVMTALVALQNYEMDETVTFTWDDMGFLEYGDAHIGIKPDEQVGMEDCMYGMLLASANEVSHAIGAHMEGGYEEFLRVMNETSKELGCTNSHWMNTHGLHDEEHYTSVRDMALIGSAVFQYDKFREITFTKQHTIPTTNITNETRTFQQNHKMVWEENSRYYEYCVGGKTGYTDQALTTLVTFATKDDTNLVAVVMRTHGGGGNAYVDTRAMLDYAFENFSKVPVTMDLITEKHVSEIEEDSCVVLPEGISFEELECVFAEPTKLGDRVGEITYLYDEHPVGSIKATITDEYYNQIHGIEETIEKEEKKEESGLPAIVKIILGVIATVVVTMIGLVCFVIYRRKQIRKKRRLRRMQRKKTEERV